MNYSKMLYLAGFLAIFSQINPMEAPKPKSKLSNIKPEELRVLQEQKSKEIKFLQKKIEIANLSPMEEVPQPKLWINRRTSSPVDNKTKEQSAVKPSKNKKK